MYVVLTTLYPDNPSISDWFGVGPAIRSEVGVTIVALAHGIAFLWVLVQLRRGALERLAAGGSVGQLRDIRDELEPGMGPVPDFLPVLDSVGVPPATRIPLPTRVPPATRAPLVSLPAWRPRRSFTELGIVGWLRDRVFAPPIRPDRTASLEREAGGRLDRFDLWLVVVLVIGSFFLRTFRLAEPYQMHFDEVYHARTATEFLQDWRYGIDHDIYEWTHPHLAKYAMAAGLVLWGGDHVQSTNALGASVRAAAVEPRRAAAGAPGGRTDERLHVATDTEIRTYDLRTRKLESIVPAPGVTALAYDAVGRQLVLGFEDGRVATLDVTALGIAGVDVAPPRPRTR
jgi:hypothetical protein